MLQWKLVFTGVLVFWGTLVFLRVVGQEVHIRRQRLLAVRRKREEIRRQAALRVPVIKATPYEVEQD